MDEVIPRNEFTIRKSAFGRTSLFLPSSNVLFREVQCMGGVTKHDNISIFHMHSLKNKNVDCWHCCECFDGERLQIPRLYDPVEQVYHVYGNFCSANCGKAYIIENSTYDRGQHLNVFVRMLREVYGIKNKVIESPPRVTLTKFGGPFSIETFRTMKNICSINKPPFVSYCMVVEERSASKASDKHELFLKSTNNEDNCGEEDISNIPERPLYEDFLENKKKDEVVNKIHESSEQKQEKKQRKRKEPVSTGYEFNTLAKYKTNNN